MDQEEAILSLFEIFQRSQKYILGKFGERERNLTKTQLYIMLAVYRQQNISMSGIASAIAASKEQTTRAVAPLVDLGYLRRYHDDENRRVVHVELTESGRRQLQIIRDNMVCGLAEQLERLPREDRERFCAAAEDMRRVMRKIEDEIQGMS